jgi:hypothetical protein
MASEAAPIASADDVSRSVSNSRGASVDQDASDAADLANATSAHQVCHRPSLPLFVVIPVLRWCQLAGRCHVCGVAHVFMNIYCTAGCRSLAAPRADARPAGFGSK